MVKERNIKILLVEDDENLGFVTKDNLELLGIDVTWQKEGDAGLAAFKKTSFDVCVFDVMLPLKDGFTLAKDIRTFDVQTPIIFLTAKALDQDKINGFTIGGDDYVTKPFNMVELALRIKAQYKRTSLSKAEVIHKFTFGNCIFDYNTQIITCKELTEKLSNKEAEILKLLCIHKNKVLLRETALKTIWGENDYFKGRSMDVFVAKLRKALKVDPTVEITTIHGRGFQLNEK